MTDQQNKLTDFLFPRTNEQPQSGLGMDRPGGVIAALAGFGAPIPIHNIYYNGKQVPLDGYRFVGCRFDKCTLVVQSTNFVLENCIVDPSCVIQYGGSMVKVIQLFTSRYDWLAERLPGLAPVKNSDGTISIGA